MCQIPSQDGPETPSQSGSEANTSDGPASERTPLETLQDRAAYRPYFQSLKELLVLLEDRERPSLPKKSAREAAAVICMLCANRLAGTEATLSVYGNTIMVLLEFDSTIVPEELHTT